MNSNENDFTREWRKREAGMREVKKGGLGGEKRRGGKGRGKGGGGGGAEAKMRGKEEGW